ncbi:MAG: hypothetical protein P4L43_01380 [Syntrophobacteraceae bacterium]|nr:hypothetical protein [Syntrophobacteraceae bacterium]
MKRTQRTGRLRPAVLLLFALFTVSCATGGGAREELKVKKLLKEEVNQFNSDIRWQDYEHAQVFVPKGRMAQYWSETDRMKRNVRLTDFELRNMEFSEDRRSASVALHYQYWSPESPILRSVTISQTWSYDELRKVWKVEDTGFSAIARTSSDD